MVDSSKNNAENGVVDGVALRLLFGEEFRDLVEGDLDASKENQVFEVVFDGTGTDDAETVKDTDAKPAVAADSKGSILTSNSSMKDLFKKNFKETNDMKSFQDSSASSARSLAQNVLVKRAMSSSTDHLGGEQKDPLSESVSFMVVIDRENMGPEDCYTAAYTKLPPPETSEVISDMPMESDKEPVPSHVIETSEIDATGNTDTRLVLNSKCRVQQVKDAEVVMEGKSITSPGSQESVDSVLLGTSANLVSKETCAAIICSKQTAEGPRTLGTVDAAPKLKRTLKRELPCLLESYAHRLLIDAGFEIRHRQRIDRERPAYFFVNTEEGFSNKALTVAWKACGKILLTSALDLERDDQGREWWDVDSFWRDMKDAMAYIDNGAHRQENSLSLLQRWKLLDPFMAVVWIDKKVGVLRKGKGLKAMNSTTLVLDGSRKPILAEMVMDGGENSAAEISSCLGRNFGRCIVNDLHMGSTDSGSRRKRSKLSSKSTSLKNGPDFPYFGPIENEILHGNEIPCLSANYSRGQINMQSEKQCPGDQASHPEGEIASSTDDNQGISSHPQEGTDIIGKMVHAETTKSKSKRPASALADGSAKKARKKSKKISEIGATEEIGDVMYVKDDQGNTLLEEDMEYHKSSKVECKANRSTFNAANPTSSKKHKMPAEFNGDSDQHVDPNITAFEDSGNMHKESNCDSRHDELWSTTGGMSPEPGSNQELVKANKSGVKKKSEQKKFKLGPIKDDDLLISAIIKKKGNGSCRKKFSPRMEPFQLEALRKLNSQKGRCKLLPRAFRKGGNHCVDGRRITLETRTGLCWLVEMGALSLKDIVQYRNPKNNAVLKYGQVTKDGILCGCCTKIFSISEFKAHAGLKQHKSSLNLLLHSGKSYIECQLKAWSTEFMKRKGNLLFIGADEKDGNDDTCGICGDGGDLICCDNCPSTYHQTCLSVQLHQAEIPELYCGQPRELPEGNWYCPNCICVTCRDLVTKETSSSLATLECAQCENKYHNGCISRKVANCGEIGANTWFCGDSCKEVFLGLRSRVGMVNYIDDGFSWTILRCSHESKKIHSVQKIALTAECNIKLAIALNLMEECFLPMVDPRTGIDMIPHVLYNLGSSFARLNYKGFYAVVLEKGDKLISVASIRVHGATVAEMPLIATCSDHRRQGMCRRLLDAIEKMLISFKVKVLVLSAIPSLVETWTSGFGFKAIENKEKQQLTDVNLMLFPGTTLLMKNLHEASSAQEPVENIDFCSREHQSNNWETLAESSNTLTEQPLAINPRNDLDRKSSLPVSTNTQLEEVNVQQRETLMPSSENCFLTAQHGEVGGVSNRQSCSSITTSDGAELPNKPISCLSESCRQKNGLTGSSIAFIVNDKRKISILGDGIKVGLDDTSLGNNGASLSDDLAIVSSSLSASNLNERKLEGVNNREVPEDNASKDEIHDFLGNHAVAKRCTAESVEA